MAVYEEQEAQQRGVANSSLTPSPDLYQSELSVFQPIAGGEIEVNSSALKSSEYFFYSYSVLFSVEDICILNKTRSEWTSNSNKNISQWTTEVMSWNCLILAPVKCASVSFEMFWPCLSVDISHHTQPQQSFVRTINTSQTQVRSCSHSEYFQTFLSSLWTLAVG